MLRLRGNDVRPAHRGELRVLVAARRTGLGQVRAYLAADILRRVSERSQLAPTVADLLPGDEDALRGACAELNIHPPRHTLTPPVTTDQLAGLFAVGVREPVFDVGIRLAAAPAGAPGDPAAPGESAPDSAAGALGDSAAGDWADAAPGGEAGVAALARYWVEVADSGNVTGLITARSGGAGGERLVLGKEPLSVRLMLLQHGYGAAPGDGGDRDEAAKTLARWRELVAGWARSPSGPMARRYSDAIAAAFADDLDTAAALRELAALADDPGVPDGVKFETFAAADLLFGLDLARDVGR